MLLCLMTRKVTLSSTPHCSLVFPGKSKKILISVSISPKKLLQLFEINREAAPVDANLYSFITKELDSVVAHLNFHITR